MIYNDSSTLFSRHLSYLEGRGGVVLISIFPPFDLEMKLSHIPKLNILGHVIKHGTIRETNMSKLKQ